MLALGSSEASAQSMSALNVPAAVRALDVDTSARPFATTDQTSAAQTPNVQSAPAQPTLAQAAAAKVSAVLTAQSGVTLANGAVVPAQPARSVTVQLPPTIDREAAWLYKSGWPLYALVDKYSTGAPLSDDATCIATAVYFEARGESLDGQLAVARVIMNRAASGRYPASWCAVVKQPAQFSFVQHGQFPVIDTNSDAWRKAQGITRVAMSNVVPSLTNDVLWYHASYVAPTWRRSLREVEHIGAHIFYRA